MPREIKPASSRTPLDIQSAIEKLRVARDLLKMAGATQALEKVRLAIRSAEGAYRHACHRKWRTENPHA